MSWWPLLRPRGAAPARWAVLDVESSGLDPTRDRLLAIAAVAVRPAGERLLIDAGDSFEVVLRQPAAAGAPDKANILVHGIGVAAQRGGVEPAEALAAFRAWAGDAPLVGFHAAFDRALIERALKAVQAPQLPNRWLDLADLAPVLRPGVAARALDDWLALYGLAVGTRHQAASDAWATAELLQRLWPALRAQGVADFAGAARLAAARRWVGG